MAEPAANLRPNPDDMRQHLDFLFANANEYDDGQVEIAVCMLRGDHKSWQSQLFPLDRLSEAVAFASSQNAAGHNIYVGAALRDPDVAPFGRSSDADHYATTAVYADLDTAEASAQAVARTRALPPDFVVCTGRHPHVRLQPYWRLEEAITSPEQHRALCGGLADCLDGDRAVTNPSRIMRLAGSVAWPTKPGRVAEMTSVVPLKYSPGTHAAEQLARVYPASNKVFSIDASGKNDAIERVGTKNSLGLDTGVIDDGRHAYMRDTIMAVLGELVGTTGATPNAQELYDAAWPQYAAHADLSRPGRGPDVFAKMCTSTIRRFERGQLRDRNGKVMTIETTADAYRDKKNREKASTGSSQEPRSGGGNGDSQQAPRIAAKPFCLKDETEIPPRQWVYGRHLIRRFISATIAPGGIGKSSLTFAEALAMATGKPLLGVNLDKPLKVWVWCLEDPVEELDRRFAAIAKHYGITGSDIGGRLFVNSGRDTPLCIARQESRTGTIIVEPDIELLEAEIRSLGIDVLTVDPFVASHMVSENDNVAINAVMRQWRHLAEVCNIAIELVHHTRKNGDGEITAETSRGAKALTDATRDTRVLNPMSESEADKFGVANRRVHFRTYSDKQNLAPPAEHSDWYKLEDVALANGPLGQAGDHVGVATRWAIPGPLEKLDKETIHSILQALHLGVIDASGNQTGTPFSKNKQGRSNTRWAGHVVIDHAGVEEGEAKRIIDAWVASGALVEVEVEIGRKPGKGLKVDQNIWSEIVAGHNVQ